jgi:hypothetical protein
VSANKRDVADVLDQILTKTTSIELKLDTAATAFAAHVEEDARLAADVKALTKRQRGYVATGLATLGAIILAGVACVAAWFTKPSN